ncbi:MAG: N-acetyltransferase [Proteobacteria bacterium]|nr:N-acetyltransferase [Pseudomonadota bacterium]MDA1325950.1 N-acetyltransferase [Pseudomonadota bacterium]
MRVPWAIYREDTHWVPPLLAERRDHLNPRKNPFFDDAEAKFWLARRGKEPVGRISAQVNHAHLKRHGDATGHFGFLEAEDNAETFQALLSTAEGWLREKGMRRATGPFSLSINDESGLLIDGFDTPPSVMMGHARPYYGDRVEEAGYKKAKDLICYRYMTDQDNSPRVATFLKRAKKIEGLVIRRLDMSRYQAELENIIDIFNDAWSDNWGFVPLSNAEVRHMGKMLRLLVRPQNFAIAEIGGEPVAMAFCLPNLNESIADLDGRLLPIGWAKLLWRVRVKTPKTSRMPLMGVRKKYQGGMTGAVLAYAVIDAVRKVQKPTGVKMAELSWILEDNLPARHVIEQFGGVAYKTYRIYERALL